jgi:O-antigen ligase
MRAQQCRGEEPSVPKRTEWLIVLLAAITLLGSIVFLLRGSWGGWVMLAGAVLLVVMLTMVIRQRRRDSR